MHMKRLTMLAVCLLLATLGSGISLANAADKPCIKAAGYDYDRDRGIVDASFNSQRRLLATLIRTCSAVHKHMM
jgi:hypothetical protein